MSLGEPTQVRQEEPQPVGIEPADTTAAEQLVKTPMWRVRLRLFRQSFARNWALVRENKMGMVGLVLIGIFAVMAISHPILMATVWGPRSEEHTSELQSRENLVCRLLLEKKNGL